MQTPFGMCQIDKWQYSFTKLLENSGNFGWLKISKEFQEGGDDQWGRKWL